MARSDGLAAEPRRAVAGVADRDSPDGPFVARRRMDAGKRGAGNVLESCATVTRGFGVAAACVRRAAGLRQDHRALQMADARGADRGTLSACVAR